MRNFLLPLLTLFSIVPRSEAAPVNETEHIDKKRLIEDVKKLTSSSKPRHYQNFDALKETTTYIEQVFRSNTDQVEIQEFKVASGETYSNITASFGPKDAERFIVGAHYDVFGPYPGADDNASGIAALLEISRVLKKDSSSLKNRIDLVAFALEEPPFFGGEDMGSAHYAKLMHQQKVKVKLMVALDMIGYFSSKPNSQERPFPLQALYPSTGDFISLVGSLGLISDTQKMKSLMKKGSPGLKVESVNAPTQIPGIDFSDHRNFWTYKYPAIMMTDTAFYRNPHYHTERDTIETLDFDTMTKVVEGLYYAAKEF